MKKKLQLAARLILGFIFFVFGLNGFLNFIPVPPMPENVMAFMGALMNTGYFLPLLKTTEVTCGALLLTNIAVPLALIVLAPITIQIFFFHLFLTPGIENLIMPIFILTLQIFLATTKYWHLYRGLFKKNA